jgi:hypothetical protein
MLLFLQNVQGWYHNGTCIIALNLFVFHKFVLFSGVKKLGENMISIDGTLKKGLHPAWPVSHCILYLGL